MGQSLNTRRTNTADSQPDQSSALSSCFSPIHLWLEKNSAAIPGGLRTKIRWSQFKTAKVRNQRHLRSISEHRSTAKRLSGGN